MEGETARGWSRPGHSHPAPSPGSGRVWWALAPGFKGPAQVQLLPLVAMLSRTATLLQTDNLSCPS